MAIPIKDTPVLKGNDAKEFSKQIEESSRKAISQSELQKLRQSQETFQKLFDNKK
ncbi:MAG: hypothetical protein Q7W45_02945 [Bacteroidota bacterium]|nr:hypothetical protein [Bacteroidota bacterium]MDP3145788.1 hypothetical protein [Bacteroidota bacterium]